jgi:cobalt-zinc-cadmium resistance protein CzcA
MIARLVEISLVQRILLCALGLTLLFGGLYSFHLLDIIAYPDPSPPMVELITQNPGWSAEEIERQITIPMEVALTGMPGLTDIRSLSIFGLSDIKVYFDFGTDKRCSTALRLSTFLSAFNRCFHRGGPSRKFIGMSSREIRAST